VDSQSHQNNCKYRNWTGVTRGIAQDGRSKGTYPVAKSLDSESGGKVYCNLCAFLHILLYSFCYGKSSLPPNGGI
jgi:hypothetical protein